jgi:hypothetical protein
MSSHYACQGIVIFSTSLPTAIQLNNVLQGLLLLIQIAFKTSFLTRCFRSLFLAGLKTLKCRSQGHSIKLVNNEGFFLFA